MLFCRLLIFKTIFFSNNISGITSECQTVWIQIRPDRMSGLIQVQTVCKGYQQTTQVGKALISPSERLKEALGIITLHKTFIEFSLQKVVWVAWEGMKKEASHTILPSTFHIGSYGYKHTTFSLLDPRKWVGGYSYFSWIRELGPSVFCPPPQKKILGISGIPKKYLKF